MNEKCGTGLISSRNELSGEKEGGPFGEYYENKLMALGGKPSKRSAMNLREFMTFHPEISRSLMSVQRLLERHYKDMQTINFVVENNVLFILRTR